MRRLWIMLGIVLLLSVGCGRERATDDISARGGPPSSPAATPPPPLPPTSPLMRARR